MLAESRRIAIMETISRAGSGVVSIVELSKQLGVSEMTVRRDLDFLEEKQLVRRVHGGAVAFQSGGGEASFEERLALFDPQKKAVGWAAAQLVNDGDRIILDAGTTTRQMVQNLAGKHRLSVITHNLPAALELSHYSHIETIVLGGLLKHKELCTIGGMARQFLASLSADKFFLSASGFSLQVGITDPDFAEVEIKQAMIQAARETILVADSAKYNLTALVRIAPLNRAACLVCDDLLSAQAIQAIEAEGIRVVTPERLAAKIVRAE